MNATPAPEPAGQPETAAAHNAPQTGQVDLPPAAPAAAVATPAPPPAASVVVTGTRSEKEIELESQLNAERETRKQREVRLSELEDENRRIKDVTRPPKKKPAGGWTVLDWED